MGIDGGRFADAPPVASADPASVLEGSGLWLIPGVYDVHTHVTWNDFHESDRDARTAADRDRLTAEALLSTLRAGVTSARDGGGATPELARSIARGDTEGPRLQVSGDMVFAEHAGPGFEARVKGILDSGASWVKLIATLGVTADPDAEIGSNFTEHEFRLAAEAAARYGARLMVHTWGGRSIDYSIEVGAGSIEHGIHLTPAQARAAAAAGLTFVPTLTVYRLLAGLIESGHLQGVARSRVDAVVLAHETAVRAAYEAGLPLALGSDYSTPEQHGTNLREIAALMRAGVPAPDALLAATANGARLLGDADGGRIATGLRADAVLLTADPHAPSTFDRPMTVAAVIREGHLVPTP